MDSPSQTNQVAVWRNRAAALAVWADEYLVVRHDVYGAYLPESARGAGSPNISYTAPGLKYRGKVFLTRDLLARHFRGESVGHVIGLHSTSRENLSRQLVVDIDYHGEGSNAPETNLQAALGRYERLIKLGFHPLLTDSNGKGGFHLRAIFDGPVPTPQVFAFGQWLVSDYADYGHQKPSETFPKQASIPRGKFGNWARVPGRHHSRDHWSRVWDGGSGWRVPPRLNLCESCVATRRD